LLKHYFSYLLVITFYAASAQKLDISHYKQIVTTSQNSNEKLAALDSILSRTFSKNQKEFIEYSKQYINLALKLDSVELAAKKAVNLQYPLTNYGNNPLNAITFLNKALARKYRIKDSLLLGRLYIKRGSANAKLDLKKAIEDYNVALQHFSQKDSLFIADTYLFRGQAYSQIGKFVKANEDLTHAYFIYEDQQAYDYMVYAQQAIINMFSMNGFYDKAKVERDALIDKMKSLGLTQYLAYEYYNQALDYKKIGKPKLELESLLLAESNFNHEQSNKTVYIGILARLIEYYCNHKLLKEAKKYVYILDNFEFNYSRSSIAEIHYLSGKAKYLQTIADYDNALLKAQKKLKIAKRLGIEDEIMQGYALLADIYYDMNQYENSIEFIRAATTLKDSIYNRSTANALAYYQTLYLTEKKEKDLVKKNTSIKLLEKDNESVKKAMLLGGIAIILMFGLILLYRNQKNLKENKILQEKFSQELINYQENERRRISKDLHDGIGQQLLVLKNKLLNNGDRDTQKLVNSTIDEVRAISRDLHPFQLQELGLTKAIEHTIDLIDENTPLFITAEIDNIDNIFSKENEVNIYRIIQESFSNILKHANSEAAKISVRKIGDNVLISIRDNGIGFDFAEKYQEEKSLGLKTLLERTRFLKGQMKVTSKKDSGAVLEFQIPI
tara:strand:+ start:109215 stop:111224 length:2010 start_codon:yes stop_codon:yes gene_type:complete